MAGGGNNWKIKLPRSDRESQKRVADDHEPVVPIPAILGPVPVQVHAVLVADDVDPVQVAVPTDLGAVTLYSVSSVPLPIEYSLGCMSLRKIVFLNTLHQVSSWLECVGGTLSPAVAERYSDLSTPQSSTAHNRGRGLNRLLSEVSI